MCVLETLTSPAYTVVSGRAPVGTSRQKSEMATLLRYEVTETVCWREFLIPCVRSGVASRVLINCERYEASETEKRAAMGVCEFVLHGSRYQTSFVETKSSFPCHRSYARMLLLLLSAALDHFVCKRNCSALVLAFDI